MLKSALLVTAGIVVGTGAISALHAQNNTCSSDHAQINVKDQKAYEASGVDKVRDGMKANGTGKHAGVQQGYCYRCGKRGRSVLIFQYPNEEAMEKDWKDNIAPWEMKPEVRKLAEFHAIGVEGVEPK